MTGRAWFKPLRRKPVRREIVAFDVEGAGRPGRFVCGSIVSAYTCSFFTDRDEMWRTLLYLGSRGAWLFAHNLEYDLPIVADDHLFEGQLVYNRGAILWATYGEGRHKARFFDSANLFPRLSVDALGAMAGIPKLELPPGLIKRLALGLPWESFTPEERSMIERYNRRDAQIVYCALEHLQDLALEIGGQLRPTLSGVSMEVYRRSYHRWPWPALGESTNELARPAFYGGRVESFRMGRVPGVNWYDVNSLYPFVLARAPFPHPGHLRLLLPGRLDGEYWNWEGVLQGVFWIPESFIPPLPHRYAGRLFFPVGRIEGTWTIAEARWAILRGAIPESIHWVLGSEVVFNPFEEFVEHLYKLRQGYLAEGNVRANLIKLILNSLYGRLGLNPSSGLEQIVPIDANTNWDDLQGWHVIELGSDLVARGPLPSRRYPTYINTPFAAQIASYGRMVLGDALLAQGEDAVYCDTDSVMTVGSMQAGEGLGAWREEATGVEVNLLGPKEYAIARSGEQREYRVKGVPAYAQQQYFEEGAARFFRALSVREALAQKKPPASWVEVIRARLSTFPKRAPLKDAHGVGWMMTRPYSIEELQRLALPAPRASGLNPEDVERLAAPEELRRAA